jgi:hypothetical protein
MYHFLNKHSEKQYLKLEEYFMNMHSFIISLQTYTEGEDLEKDSFKLIHFSALCKRITDGIEQFDKYYKRVRDARFQGDSAQQPQHDSLPSRYDKPDNDVQITANPREYVMILEALEHLANSYPDDSYSKELQTLADQIKI